MGAPCQRSAGRGGRGPEKTCECAGDGAYTAHADHTFEYSGRSPSLCFDSGFAMTPYMEPRAALLLCSRIQQTTLWHIDRNACVRLDMSINLVGGGKLQFGMFWNSRNRRGSFLKERCGSLPASISCSSVSPLSSKAVAGGFIGDRSRLPRIPSGWSPPFGSSRFCAQVLRTRWTSSCTGIVERSAGHSRHGFTFKSSRQFE